MKNDTENHKDFLIQYIRMHNTKSLELPLETFSFETLVIMKVELEMTMLKSKEKKHVLVGLD